MTHWNRLWARRWLPLVVTSTGALIAAALAQVVHVLADKGWSWSDFATDVIKNAFIAVVVTFLLSALTTYQLHREQAMVTGKAVLRRIEVVALAITGWDTIPTTPGQPAESAHEQPDIGHTLSEHAISWRRLADRMEVIRGDVLPEGRDDPSVTPADLARWQFHELAKSQTAMGGYLMEGGRMRRLIWLRSLRDDLAAVETSPDVSLAEAAEACRRSAIELEAWVQHTDTVIAERLLVVESVPSLGVALPNLQQCLRDVETLPLHSSTLSADWAYLLLDFVERVKAIAAETDFNDEGFISDALNVARRILGAFRNELYCAALLADQFAVLVQEARRVTAE